MGADTTAIPIRFGRLTAKFRIPLVKFRTNLARRFPKEQQDAILAVSLNQTSLERTAVNEYVDLYVM